MAAWKNRKVLRKGLSSSGGDASDYGQTSKSMPMFGGVGGTFTSPD